MLLIGKLEKYLDDRPRKGVIHIGGHDGEERVWYKAQGFTPVIWFEPNVNLFPRLTANIKEYPGNVAYNLGVHDTLKEAFLHISSNDGQSSSLLPLGTHKIHAPHVRYVQEQKIKLTRMDDFIKEKNINIKDYNFLNLDIQGVELNAIKSFGKLIEAFDYVYVEVNEAELYVGCSLLPDVDAYLGSFGFIRLITEITKAEWGDTLYKRY